MVGEFSQKNIFFAVLIEKTEINILQNECNANCGVTFHFNERDVHANCC